MIGRIGAGPGQRQLAFQRVTEWLPPRWPDPAHPQQLHLDTRGDDAERAEQELLALGATRLPGTRERSGNGAGSFSPTLGSGRSAIPTGRTHPDDHEAARPRVTQPTRSRNAAVVLTHVLPCFHYLLAGICVDKKPVDARAA